MADDGQLDRVQEAFVETGAVQCGFCTPGLIVATVDLLRHKPDPTDDEIREAMSGNLCRCTGYAKIFDAVRLAAGRASVLLRLHRQHVPSPFAEAVARREGRGDVSSAGLGAYAGDQPPEDAIVAAGELGYDLCPIERVASPRRWWNARTSSSG